MQTKRTPRPHQTFLMVHSMVCTALELVLTHYYTRYTPPDESPFLRSTELFRRISSTGSNVNISLCIRLRTPHIKKPLLQHPQRVFISPQQSWCTSYSSSYSTAAALLHRIFGAFLSSQGTLHDAIPEARECGQNTSAAQFNLTKPCPGV
jgi:hypothetical protein